MKDKELRLIEGFVVGPNAEVGTHIQIANDKILFNYSRWEDIVVFKKILRCFQFSSGLKYVGLRGVARMTLYCLWLIDYIVRLVICQFSTLARLLEPIQDRKLCGLQ